MSSITPCIHQDTGGYKILYKANAKGKKSDGTICKKRLSGTFCPLCFSYGLRAAMLEARGWKITKPSGGIVLATTNENDTTYAKGQFFYNEVMKTKTRPLFLEQLKQTDDEALLHAISNVMKSAQMFRFEVKEGQHGEMYHGLISAMLVGQDIVKLDVTQAKFTQVDFLRCYLPSIDKVSTSAGNRGTATAYISQVFGSLDSHGQEAMHAQIRSYLNDDWLTKNNDFRYATPGYAAKFWINRFLRLTEKKKLPDPSSKLRVAFIWVRRDALANDARSMTEENLLGCFNAIQKSNKLAPSPDSLIQKVIIFGDFSFLEGREWMKYGEKIGVTVDYICSPFRTQATDAMKTTKIADRVLAEQIDKLWAFFRGAAPFNEYLEGTPTEVKTYAIYLALYTCFGGNICYIGFRSASLDGAGFLGSPIFYIDDTITKGANYQRDFADGHYLIDLENAGNNNEERMLLMTKTTNTFIRINIVNNAAKAGEALVFNESNGQNHLAAALSIYFSADQFWRKRIEVMKDAKWRETQLKHLSEFN